MSWSNRYLGLPYLDRGRSRAGVDCWGVPYLVFTEAGLDCPSYAEGYARSDARADVDQLISTGRAGDFWQAVAEGSPLQACDILFFRRGGYESHCALYVERGRMLHVDVGMPSRIERFGFGPFVPSSVLRHPALAGEVTR